MKNIRVLYDKKFEMTSLVMPIVFESLRDCHPENASSEGLLEYYGVTKQPKKAVFIGKCATSLYSGFRKFYKNIPSFVYSVGEGKDCSTKTTIFKYGSHPLPSRKNVQCCKDLVKFLEKDKGDTLFFISGGTSSLLCLPEEGFTLKEISRIEKNLLLSGAPIKEINIVRMALSKLRGGGIAEIVKPFNFYAFIWCDVNGKDYKMVGSAPLGGFKLDLKNEAQKILSKYNININSPIAQKFVKKEKRGSKVIKLFDGESLINQISIRLKGREIKTKILKFKEGTTAEEVAKAILMSVKKTNGPMVFLGNGEFIVNVKKEGFGGRCSHLCLLVYRYLKEEKNWFFSAIATDGKDGNGGGGGFIHSKCSFEENEIEKHLANFSSGKLLKKYNLLYERSDSGNNLRDIFVLVVEKKSG